MAENIEFEGKKYPVDLERKRRESFGPDAPPSRQGKTQDDLEREAMDRAPRDAPGAQGAEAPEAPAGAQARQEEPVDVRVDDRRARAPEPEGTTGQGAGQGADMSALLDAMKQVQIELVAIRSSLENGIQITG